MACNPVLRRLQEIRDEYAQLRATPTSNATELRFDQLRAEVAAINEQQWTEHLELLADMTAMAEARSR